MQLTGIVRSVVFRNEQNSFTVMTIEVPGESSTLKAVGTVGPVQEGDTVLCEGEWEIHQRYGRNFRVQSCRTVLPQTKEGIAAFLKSGHIAGIGPKMAAEITEAFGVDTLRILDEQPEKLLELHNFGPKRLDAVVSGWRSSKEKREEIIFLHGLGLNRSYVNKALQRFGEQAALKIRNNPYALTEIPGIGFGRADRVARDMGISLESAERIKAGLHHTMNECVGDGHSCYPRADFLARAEQLLKIGPMAIEQMYEQLVQEGKYIEKTEAAVMTFRADLAYAESAVAHHLKRIARGSFEQRLKYASVDPKAVEKKLDLYLSSGQTKALETIFMSKIVVVTGGPGTGKTTLIKVVISIGSSLGFRIKMAAPTGRAAQRMKEATGLPAQTIHRLLEYNPALGSFMRREERTLEADILVIDEMSMIDVFLMNTLVRAIDNNCQLIMVGDADQLPSVGPGNVLGDIIASASFAVIRLTDIFRQAERSLITTNAHKINRGEKLTLPEKRGPAWNNDFYFISRQGAAETASTMLQVVTKRIPEAFQLDPRRDIQVLTPMNNGPAGATELNLSLQNVLNPPSTAKHSPEDYIDLPFRVGDRVMQIRNNYNRGNHGVFNGDIGFVHSIHWLQKTLSVQFEELITYDFDDLHELILAYAITVHKSQGSEYPAVVVPLLTQHYVLLQRNLIYTAVTRAKKLVVLIGSYKALSIAIHNDQTSARFTGLKQLIIAKDI